MSLNVLVRRNVLDPVRSRSIWLLLGTFVVLFGASGYFLGGAPPGALPEITALIMAQLAPLAALAMTYDTIAGPRQSGSLRVLLSYPYTRRELVLGTLVGRILLVSLAVVVGIVVGLLSTVVFGGSPDVAALAIVLGLSVLLATSIVGLTMGISANVSTSSRASVLAFGAYLLFTGFWGIVPTVVRYVINGFSFAFGPTPEWVRIWNQLNPLTAFRQAVGVLLQGQAAEAFYHTVWFALLVLVAWFALPVVLGIVGFERGDL